MVLHPAGGVTMKDNDAVDWSATSLRDVDGIEKPYIAMARALTSQPWANVGLNLIPADLTLNKGQEHGMSWDSVEGRFHTMVDHLVALLLVRIVAVVASRRRTGAFFLDSNRSSTLNGEVWSSTLTSCPPAIEFDGSCPTSDSLPEELTPAVLSQLRSFVGFIGGHYRGVKYHSLEHAYHVTLSANKILDSMLRDDLVNVPGNRSNEGGENDVNINYGTDRHYQSEEQFHNGNDAGFGINTNRTRHASSSAPQSILGDDSGFHIRSSRTRSQRNAQTYGLYSDPIAQMALIFSALIHDVDHRGITNQQLVLESDELAIMYNDQSVAEQRSISLAFYELMRPLGDLGHDESVVISASPLSDGVPKSSVPVRYAYGELRRVMFGECPPVNHKVGKRRNADYVRFRRLVIDMVLCTDIASPERIQVAKSKYKAAFGPGSTASGRGAVRRRGSNSSRKQKNADDFTKDSTIPVAARDLCFTERGSLSSFNQSLSCNPKQSLRQRFLDTRRSVDCSDLKRKVYNTSSDSVSSDNELLPPRISDYRKVQLWNRHSIAANGDTYNFFSAATGAAAAAAVAEDESEDAGRPSSFGIYSNNCKHRKTIAGSDMSIGDDGGEILDMGTAADPPRKEAGYAFENSEWGLPQTPAHTMASLVGDDADMNFEATAARAGEQYDELVCPPKASSETGSRRSSTRSYSGGRAGVGLGLDLGADLDADVDLCLRVTSRQSSHRRFSAPVIHHATHEFRLGIRRALNLTGSTIGLFNSSNSLQDEDNELRANVVLELIITASDVAPIMQGWENYLKWSKRLYFEQKEAYENGRGLDPQSGWFENQITFFDSYGMPLAKHLAEVGVFGSAGAQFADNILENRLRWLAEGMDCFDKLVRDWDDHKSNTQNS